jgi:hypothetical protein
MRVTVRDFDLYFATGDEDFQYSLHETGKTHTKVAQGRKRLIDRPKARVQDLRGRMLFWQGAPDTESMLWNYRPQVKEERRNLIVDVEGFKEVDPTIDLWIIEKGGLSHLVNIIHRRYVRQLERELMDCAMIDWTQPWILAVVHKPSAELLDSMRKVVVAAGLGEGGRFSGVVTGGPPVGGPIQVWPDSSPGN